MGKREIKNAACIWHENLHGERNISKTILSVRTLKELKVKVLIKIGISILKLTQVR